MDIIFNIIENLPSVSVYIMTVICSEKYNVSLGMSNDDVTIYLYDSTTRDIIKYNGTQSSKQYKLLKEFIIHTISNTPIKFIHGVTDVENKDYLNKYFNTSSSELDDILINFTKNFYW